MEESSSLKFFLENDRIRMGWLDDAVGVLLVELGEGITWEDMIRGKRYTLQLQEQRPISYIIADFMWTNQSLPLGGNDYESLAEIIRLDSRFRGTIIYIVPTFPMQLAMRIVSRSYKIPLRAQQHYFVRSRVDAFALLAAQAD